jgi:hypothetical protein
MAQNKALANPNASCSPLLPMNNLMLTSVVLQRNIILALSPFVRDTVCVCTGVQAFKTDRGREGDRADPERKSECMWCVCVCVCVCVWRTDESVEMSCRVRVDVSQQRAKRKELCCVSLCVGPLLDTCQEGTALLCQCCTRQRETE